MTPHATMWNMEHRDSEKQATPKAEEPRIDEFHKHEALDRAHLFSDQFERHLASHPFIETTPQLKDKADQIANALGDLYQAIGVHINEFDNLR